MKKEELIIGKTSVKELNKVQKEFNRLTKKIEKLKKDFQSKQDSAEALRKRVDQVLSPLADAHNAEVVNVVKFLDVYLDRGKVTATEKKKATHFILENCSDLISEGFEELTPIHDKYSAQSFDEMASESDAASAELMRKMVEMMTGHIIPDNIDLNTPEKMQAYIAELAEQEEKKDENRRRKREEAKAQKPKSEKQAAKEQKKIEEETKQYKSVRSVYMDLVKAFHPDREPDETEKTRKTAIMQRVISAYENNDLLGLLQLQLELERIEPEHLDTIADEKLLHYNKVLKNQVRDLEQEIMEFSFMVADMLGLSPFDDVDINYLTYKLERDIEDIKQMLKNIAELTAQMQADPSYVKVFLKGYKIPKKGGNYHFGNMFFE